MYYGLDEIMRDTTLYLAQDFNLGMGVAIFAVSAGIKLIFTPLHMKAQVQGLKMKLIQPEMKEYQNKMSEYSKKGDFGGVKQIRTEMNNFKKRVGIDGLAPLGAMSQMPFLFTWFFCLRYMSMSPDLFPEMQYEGFFWFENLCKYDQYFILPMLSACLTSLNISYSPNAQNTAGASQISKYMKFFKFIPFFGFPVFMSFPAGMTMYWVTVSSMQLISTFIIR